MGNVLRSRCRPGLPKNKYEQERVIRLALNIDLPWLIRACLGFLGHLACETSRLSWPAFCFTSESAPFCWQNCPVEAGNGREDRTEHPALLFSAVKCHGEQRTYWIGYSHTYPRNLAWSWIVPDSTGKFISLLLGHLRRPYDFVSTHQRKHRLKETVLQYRPLRNVSKWLFGGVPTDSLTRAQRSPRKSPNRIWCGRQ